MPTLPPLVSVVTAVPDVILGLCVIALVFHYVQTKFRELPLPPGPKPLPLIGNVLDMPNDALHVGLHWMKHRALYGLISSVKAFGSTIIIINDAEVAFNLLDKRSNVYSNRPSLTFAGELVGLNETTTFNPYGDTLRLHRKWMQHYMGSPSSLEIIENIQEIETHRLLLRTLESPDKFRHHLRTLSGAIILKLTYGYNVEPDGRDFLVDLANEGKTIFAEATQMGRWFVDILPALKYVPEWLPGAGFKKTARKWKSTQRAFFDKPFEFVKQQMLTGNALPSFVSDILERGIADTNEEIDLKNAAATMYGGGADTTVSSMETFYLAMLLHPAIFNRAQEEIDQVIGSERLPNFKDRNRLRYINALVKETLRWEVILPTGIPHATAKEDTYEGYRIPKGAIIIPNIWEMTNNPETYPEPLEFKPERFLGKNGNDVEKDPRTVVFGFGRRICPGKELAENSLFIAIAMLAAVFDIRKAKDDSGQEIEPVRAYTTGILRHPGPFMCSITPRSETAVALIRSVLEEHPFEKGDGDKLKDL